MDAEKSKGGRPPLAKGEQTVQIGPFLVGDSLRDWLVVEAKRREKSQGHIVRLALMRERLMAEKNAEEPA